MCQKREEDKFTTEKNSTCRSLDDIFDVDDNSRFFLAFLCCHQQKTIQDKHVDRHNITSLEKNFDEFQFHFQIISQPLQSIQIIISADTFVCPSPEIFLPLT